MKKIAVFYSVIILSLITATALYFTNDKKKSGDNQQSQKKIEYSKTPQNDSTNSKVIFTSKIFNPALTSHIIPLGELNGGYIETQTINGVTINNKMDAQRNTPEIDVYAPTDMTLEDYSYFTGGPHTANWHLGFRISKDVKLSFDHITWVPDELKAVTPPTPTSGYVPPLKKIFFRAGALIAKTSGTDQAHNWNIYLRDNRHTNTFANQERFKKIQDRYDFINASCPFNYYEDSEKQQFIALMGATKAGQSKSCGTNSRDVIGSISGLWHLTKDGFEADYQERYATPFSIYKNSAGEIIIYEINRQRFILDKSNPTYQDPATVISAHCYALTEYGDTPAKGYVYFMVVSDMEMRMKYEPTGTCPGEFPERGSVTYYR